jgi:UDP-2,3-diacylglucosamine hydrolase
MKLALIAGRGDLPALVVEAAGAVPLVCAYEGTPVTALAADLSFRLETLGTLLAELGNRGTSHICFAGGLDRPVLDPSKLDAATAPLVPRFLQALQAGDDGALRVVIEIFEEKGFTVLGAQQIAPDLLAQNGVLSTAQPDDAVRADAALAADQIRAMSSQDKGQACVVVGGQVIAMEDARGTDAMLAQLAPHTGGVLFKGPKAGQSRLIDLPTVGPQTFKAAHAAGLGGVVVEADDVLVLHRDACVALANEYGLVFWARPSG